MSENRIPSDASAAVEVNGEKRVTMWLGDVSVSVPVSSVGDFQGRGFVLLSKDQVHTVVSEIKAYAPQVVASAERYAEGVAKDGEINTDDQAELATLQKALKVLSDSVNSLISTTAQLYPVRQGTPAVMTKEGETIYVDPSQVELYIEQGWRRTDA